jgi:uncharacterized protein (DUF2249 family)
MTIIHMDNRGLKPPEPMIRILTACDALRSGERIEALMDRRPIFLFPELEEREVEYDCVERGDGSFLLTVRRDG